MKNLILILSTIVILVVGCMPFHQPDPTIIKDIYYNQIREWQNRMKIEMEKEDLTGIVDDVVKKSIYFAKYKTEKKDHWDTLNEFIEGGFQGDCEDFAVFIFGNLKKIGFPYGVKILAVDTLMGIPHAIIKVEVKPNTWKIYETVPIPLGSLDKMFYKPIVEFDVESITYY